MIADQQRQILARRKLFLSTNPHFRYNNARSRKRRTQIVDDGRLAMSTRFFTNHGEQTLFKKFQGVFESNTDIETFDALVGYLRSSGYFALRPYLEKVPHSRAK